MGIPILRFTLSHTPKAATIQSVSLPGLASGVNIAGANTDWITGATPTVNLPGTGPTTLVTSDMWANDYNFLPGRSYTFNYSLPFSFGANTIGKTIVFVILDAADAVLIADSKSVSGTTGTHSDTSTFTAPAGAVKYGFYVSVFNGLTNAGSTYSISSVSASITIPAETGSPTSKQISEPLGWKDAKLKLERHEDFHSLIEYFEGSFTFYGNNGIVDGGIDYIKHIEDFYGFNATIDFVAEVSFDELSYETIFVGQLDLTTLQERSDHKMEVAVVRNDFWYKFISRMDTPVNLSSTTDLDGNSIPATEPVNMNLTSQVLDQKYEGHGDQEATLIFDIPDNQYGGIDFATEITTEINEKFTIARLESSTRPFPLFTVEYAGNYDFDIEVRTSTAVLFGSATDSRLEVRLQINEDAPIVLTQTGESFGLESWVNHNYLNTLSLKKNDSIRLYFFNNNAPGTSYQFIWFANLLQDSHLIITAHTVFPSTEEKGYLLHDSFAGVIERITGTNGFYSEVMGATSTNMRQYASNGCYWKNVLMKGLHIRGYTLEEKPFFTSFNDLWKGANPIFNLSLGYDTVNGEEVIRIEGKAKQYDPTVSHYVGNVKDISREYDPSRMFNRIEVGYNKWQSEDVSGIDDPQTKKVYSTIIK